MRNLEETIDALSFCAEVCISDCSKCHYCDDLRKDAQQWLKIFRDTKVKLEDERQNYRDVTRALRTEHAWQEYRKERQ